MRQRQADRQVEEHTGLEGGEVSAEVLSIKLAGDEVMKAVEANSDSDDRVKNGATKRFNCSKKQRLNDKYEEVHTLKVRRFEFRLKFPAETVRMKRTKRQNPNMDDKLTFITIVLIFSKMMNSR